MINRARIFIKLIFKLINNHFINSPYFILMTPTSNSLFSFYLILDKCFCTISVFKVKLNSFTDLLNTPKMYNNEDDVEGRRRQYIQRLEEQRQRHEEQDRRQEEVNRRQEEVRRLENELRQMGEERRRQWRENKARWRANRRNRDQQNGQQ
jgi:hypothetical protein